MALFYSHRVNNELSNLGVVKEVAQLDTVQKMKIYGEKENYWPKETAALIFYILPEDMKPKSSEAIIQLWVDQGEIRQLILEMIQETISQDQAVSSIRQDDQLDHLLITYSIDVSDVFENRIESVVVSVSRFISVEAVKKSGRNFQNLREDERYLAMLICLVASSHLTRITGLSFEIFSMAACIDFEKTKGDFGELITNYNRMVQDESESRVIEAIENQVSQFVSTGDEAYLVKLGELYNFLVAKIK